MADSRPPRRRPHGTPGADEPDGVLFDPAHPPPLEPVEPEPSRRRGPLVAIVLVAVAAGAYLAYDRTPVPANEEPLPLSQPVVGPSTQAESPRQADNTVGA